MGRIETIAIGDELLDGRVLDSNARHAAAKTHPLGWQVGHMNVIPDAVEAIENTLSVACARADIVICSGGLGPTDDDLTRHAVASWLGVELFEDEASLKDIEAKFRAFGVRMAPNNRRQALFPVGAKILENEVGTAPAFCVEKGQTQIYFFPGVPREYKWLFERYLLPVIAPKASHFHKRTLVYFGLGESTLETRLNGLERESDLMVGYRAHFPEIHVTVSARGEQAQDRVDGFVASMQGELGKYFVGEGSTLPSLVVSALAARGLKIATAESCTGGLIGGEITAVAGASNVYPGGAVTYSNEIKTKLLGVKTGTLERVGAVSQEVAVQMAAGASRVFGAELAIAVTGIAGPGGGTAEKPVGTVHVGMATPDGLFHRKLSLRGGWGRERIRSATAHHALMIALRWLEGRLGEDAKVVRVDIDA